MQHCKRFNREYHNKKEKTRAKDVLNLDSKN